MRRRLQSGFSARPLNFTVRCAMVASGFVLVALLVTATLILACAASALYSIARIRRLHEDLWQALGRPYGPAGFAGAAYFRWLYKRHYLKTTDQTLIRLCQFQLIGPYVAAALGVALFVVAYVSKAPP